LLSLFIASRLFAGLSRLGFAPINASSLGPVLRVAWVLVITGFSVAQFVGLFAYIVSFPVWFPFYIAFHKEVEAAKVSSSQQGPKTGLRPSQRRWPTVAWLGCALLAWYILFGDTSSIRQVWIAVFLSGGLLLALAYRAFQRAKPISHADVAVLTRIERFASSTTTTVRNQWEKNKLQKKKDVIGTVKIYSWYLPVLVYQAAFVRGKRGRDRTYSLVVFQYALSLVFLLVSAVIFWAFCFKATSPTDLQLSRCMLVSASRFLPGVTSSVVPPQTPLWILFGPGFTAWILLGIYVAASSSLLAGKQNSYAQRASNTYLLLRRCIVAVRRYLVQLGSLPV
jgi:hypothetical protein